MNNREAWLTRIAHVKAEGRIPIIAELKPSSPAAGELLCARTLTDITKAYVAGGAACISVVTGRWFGGNLAMLAEVAKATSLPLLRKDLIVNADQIIQSRDYGANAVLLTKKILQNSHLIKMIDLCISLNITPFIEVSSQAEIQALPESAHAIIGITNRDIAQKELDVDSGLNSLNLLHGLSRNFGAVISASGIDTPADATRLFQAGFDGLLMGTALLKAPDPKEAVKAFSQVRLNAFDRLPA
jgi:indole-3-glycerol phosphate synthase